MRLMIGGERSRGIRMEWVSLSADWRLSFCSELIMLASTKNLSFFAFISLTFSLFSLPVSLFSLFYLSLLSVLYDFIVVLC